MVERGAAPRRQAEHRGIDHAAGGLARRPRRDPDRRHPQLAGVPLPGRDQVTELRRVEADCEVGLDGHPLDLPGRGVDPGGDVAGDHRRPAAVDGIDRDSGRPRGGPQTPSRRSRRPQPPSPPAKHPGRPGCRRDKLERLDLEPHPPQMPGGNQPISAVVSLPANDPHRPLGRQLSHSLSQRRPRSLHQLLRRNPLRLNRPAIDCPNPIGVIEGRQPELHRISLAFASKMTF